MSEFKAMILGARPEDITKITTFLTRVCGITEEQIICSSDTNEALRIFVDHRQTLRLLFASSAGLPAAFVRAILEQIWNTGWRQNGGVIVACSREELEIIQLCDLYFDPIAQHQSGAYVYRSRLGTLGM